MLGKLELQRQLNTKETTFIAKIEAQLNTKETTFIAKIEACRKCHQA